MDAPTPVASPPRTDPGWTDAETTLGRIGAAPLSLAPLTPTALAALAPTAPAAGRRDDLAARSPDDTERWSSGTRPSALECTNARAAEREDDPAADPATGPTADPATDPAAGPGPGPAPVDGAATLAAAADVAEAMARAAAGAITPARVGRALVRAASFAVVGAVAWLLLLTTVPRLAGWQPTVITGHSMEPAILRGDVVLVRPAPAAAYVPGAVITFEDINRPGHLVTHRVVAVRDDRTLVTKGDNNHDDDPQSVDPARVKGRAVLRVPYAGRPVVWTLDHRWPPLAVTVVVLGLALRTAFRPASAAGRGGPRRQVGAAPADGTA